MVGSQGTTSGCVPGSLVKLGRFLALSVWRQMGRRGEQRTATRNTTRKRKETHQQRHEDGNQPERCCAQELRESRMHTRTTHTATTGHEKQTCVPSTPRSHHDYRLPPPSRPGKTRTSPSRTRSPMRGQRSWQRACWRTPVCYHRSHISKRACR
jgi:hypothetical protein